MAAPRLFRTFPATAAVLLCGAILSAAAVLWMAWRLIHQDLVLESQQARQRLEAAADTATALLDRALLRTQQSLADPTWAPPHSGATLIRAGSGSLTVTPPRSLLFSPSDVAPATVSDPLLVEGERAEFSAKDPEKALSAYRQLLSSSGANLRAAALLRIARVQANAGSASVALDAYGRLAALNDTYVEGTPSVLAARLARARLARASDRMKEALALGQALNHPSALPTREVFLFYTAEAQALSDGAWRPDARLLAVSESVREQWSSLRGSGRVSTSRQGLPLTLIWSVVGNDTVVLAADMDFASQEWVAAANTALRSSGTVVALEAVDAPGALFRPATSSGLPWPISVRTLEAPAVSVFGGRRLPLALGAAGLALMLLLAGYLSWRAVARELAAARMQADFVAAVSHEFRTPLTALRQFTGMLLERDSLTTEQRRTCYEAQSRSTERLSRLVESLLDFRRMDAGARRYILEPVDASDFTRKVTDEFARESGADLRLHTAPSCPVMADPAALSLALWNLLDNAVKYTASPAPIEVSVQPEGDEVLFHVTDRGAGIPPGDQSRIFEKFVRGAEASRMGIKGTGIGLAMVMHVARAHRGTVKLASTVGQGSTFTLVLPALKD
jgi:signal transduction histidine kinase